MAADIISAGRAIGNPHDHNHPVPAACAWRKHHRRGQESSEEFEQEQYHEPSEYLGPEESNVDDDDGEMSLEENDQMNGSVPSTSLQRKRSLQLEKSQTMSCVEDPKRNTALTEIRTHGSRMSMKLLKTVIWLPTDLTLSLSKGFHNAPKLYHDRMVKPSPTVIGFRSGVRAAGTVHLTPAKHKIQGTKTADMGAGTSGRLLLRYYGLGHSTSVWPQAPGCKRSG